MSLSYQLEILCYQVLLCLFIILEICTHGYSRNAKAQRMRSLGWADFLKVEMSPDHKILVVSYWVYVTLERRYLTSLMLTLCRRPILPQIPGRPPPNRSKLPPHGGTLTISIVPAATLRSSPKTRILAELQARAKLGEGNRPSDEVEGLKFEIKWEPTKGVFGVGSVSGDDVNVKGGELLVVRFGFSFSRLCSYLMGSVGS